MQNFLRRKQKIRERVKAMPSFMQKGEIVEARDVETVHCKDRKTRFRRIDNKTWVKVLTLVVGSASIRLAYEGRRSWNNRIFEVHFDFYALEKISEEKAIQIAKDIISEDDYANFFDFYNKETVIGFEQAEHKITEDDLRTVEDVEESEDEITFDNEKVLDLRGWGAT